MRSRIGLGVLAIALLASALEARADTKIELNPFAGVRFGGSLSGGTYADLAGELDFAEGDQYGINLDIPFAAMGMGGPEGKKLMLEAMFNSSGANFQVEPRDINSIPPAILDRFEEDDGKLIIAKARVMYLHLGVLNQFRTTGVMPYVTVSLGGTVFSATEGDFDNVWKFSSRLGAGFKTMFNEKMGTRFQFSTYFTSMPSDDYWCDAAGCWEYEEWHSFFQAEASGGLVFAF